MATAGLTVSSALLLAGRMIPVLANLPVIDNEFVQLMMQK